MRTTAYTLSSRVQTWLVPALLAFGSVVCDADTNGFDLPEPPQIRIAFSKGVIGGINHNDAKASVMAWGKALLDQRNIHAVTMPSIFDRPEDMFRALQAGQIDCAAALTNEFLAWPEAAGPESVYLTVRNGRSTVQYVLLVHQASDISDLGGLQDRHLELHESSFTSLVSPWLDICLTESGLGLPETVFRRIDRSEKVSKTVLRVFFRQVDACVVTREAFETMGELNPQLHKELRVLATSPNVVPSIFFLRPGFTGHLREELEASFTDLQKTVAGRQALTVFQGEELAISSLSCLDSARDLLAAATAARTKSEIPRTIAENTLLGQHAKE